MNLIKPFKLNHGYIRMKQKIGRSYKVLEVNDDDLLGFTKDNMN